MDAEKIPLTTICARLERAIHADVGMKGLQILLYGWRRKDPFAPSGGTLGMRRKNGDYGWLLRFELQRLSIYAGYNLCLENG